MLAILLQLFLLLTIIEIVIGSGLPSRLTSLARIAPSTTLAFSNGAPFSCPVVNGAEVGMFSLQEWTDSIGVFWLPVSSSF